MADLSTLSSTQIAEQLEVEIGTPEMASSGRLSVNQLRLLREAARRLRASAHVELDATKRGDRIGRLTVVDHDRGGRMYERRDCQLEYHLQDDGRTLKVFVTRRDEA